MKQHEAVIQTLESLGGQATLAELYREVMKLKDCKWETKTPFASIRRIVQIRPEIFKVRPGLWALRSYQGKLGLADEKRRNDFEEKIKRSAFDEIKNRGRFLGYNTLVKQYEYELLKSNQEFVI